MRAGLAATLCAAIVAAAAAAPAAHAGPPAVAAKAAFVVQPDTHDVIYARHADARRPVASTTKLMTALVALDRLRLNQVVTVAPYAPAAGESLVGLVTGEHMRFADLLRAMMLPSANDAAHAVAIAAAGSVSAFVALMNQRVRRLGLHDTHFANPIGLDQRGNYSSARDLVEMALLLRRDAFIRRITDQPRAILRSGDHPRVVVNRNDLVARYPFVDGVKTGHTSGAGYVLVGAARRNGVSVLSSVLGDPSITARDADSIALLRYGLSLYHRSVAAHQGQVLRTVGVRDQGDATAPLAAARDVAAVARRDEHLALRLVGAPSEVTGPLAVGARVGTVEVLRRGQVVGRTPLVVARAIPKASFSERIRAWAGRSGTLLLLAFLAGCTVALVLLRRRVVRRRGPVQEAP